MAIDEALALSSGSGSPPTLRSYLFEPPSISVGRSQNVPGELHLNAFRFESIDVVRRPTGGLAILHKDDFTYSVTLPFLKAPLLRGDPVFKLVAKGILAALEILGIKAELVAHEGGAYRPGSWCFESMFGVDIEWEGMKICGSAQKKYPRSILQHGSLFLKLPEEKWQKVTGEEEETSSLVTLEEAAGRSITWNETHNAFEEGFTLALDVRMENGVLSEWERSLANRLMEEKYGTREWLLGGSCRF